MRLADGGQDFDHLHAAVVANRTMSQRVPGKLLETVMVIGNGFRSPGVGWRHGQQAATKRQSFLAVAVAEEAVVADALKPVGQDMEQEAADELVRGEDERLLVMIPIVLP